MAEHIGLKPFFAGRHLEVFVVMRGARCPVVEFIDKLPQKERDKIDRLIVLFAQLGPPGIGGKFRKLHAGAHLYELKSGNNRVLLFFEEPGKAILTHGFKKRQDRCPPQEIERALRLRDEYTQWLGGQPDGP